MVDSKENYKFDLGVKGLINLLRGTIVFKENVSHGKKRQQDSRHLKEIPPLLEFIK